MHDVSHSYAKLIAQGEQIPFALQADSLMLALRTLPAVTHVQFCTTRSSIPLQTKHDNWLWRSAGTQLTTTRSTVIHNMERQRGKISRYMLCFPQVISSPISFSRNPECKAIIYCWHVQCNAELQRQLNNPKMKVTVGAHH